MEKDKIICNHCGRKVSDNLKLCSFCGYKLPKINDEIKNNRNALSENKIIKSIKDKISNMDKNKNNDFIIISVFVLIFGSIILYAIITANNNYISNKNNTNNNTTTTSTTKSSKEVLTITKNDDYIKKVADAVEQAVEDNKYYSSGSYYLNDSYINFGFALNKKIDKETMKEQAKIISDKILINLQKYEYKRGSIFVMNFDYINLNFYGIDVYGRQSRGDGVWVQFDIMKVNSQTTNDITVQ